MMNLILASALKSTSILAAAWLCAWMLRRHSADLRHRIWLAAILALAAMPALTALLPHSAVSIAIASQLVSSPESVGRVTRAVPWLLTLWAAGAALAGLRFAAGLARIAWITYRAEVRDGVHYSAEIATPLTWGIFRPAIVLPASAAEWSEARREIVMRHEWAHIDRNDWLWQTVARLATAAFWFHPLVWLASAELRREAEQAVDDRVLSAGTDPAEYAEQLLAVARSMTVAAPAQAVAMVRKPALEARVRSILDATRPRFRTGGWARAAIAAATIAAVLPLAAFQQGSAHKIGEKGLTPPRVASKIEPRYTPEARDAKIEGTVVLRCVVDENGLPQDIQVVRSLDAGLDNEAVIAVSQWHFIPGKKDGNPVAVQASIEVNFHLI